MLLFLTERQTIILRLKLLSIVLACSLAAHAQEFNTHWIHAPHADSLTTADSLAHIQFRHTYLSFGTPRQATVTVTSTGFFRLFVNQCNVGTAAFFPPRASTQPSTINHQPSATTQPSPISQVTFDVTDYLRPDTNVIALCYAPVTPQASNKLVSVCVYGIDADGRPFSFNSDSTWLCRSAETAIAITVDTLGHPSSFLGENIDGRRHDPDWDAATICDSASWAPAVPYRGSRPEPLTVWDGLAVQPTNHRQGLCPAPRTIDILDPDSVLTHGDTLIVYFPQPFTGRVRLTLRNARRGERVTFGRSTYICSGRLDEQAMSAFAVTRQRIVRITGARPFRPSHVVNIEGIVLSNVPIE